MFHNINDGSWLQSLSIHLAVTRSPRPRRRTSAEHQGHACEPAQWETSFNLGVETQNSIVDYSEL